MNPGDHWSETYIAGLQSSIRRRPVESLALGFLAGFVVAGGQRNPVGQTLVGLATRVALRLAVSRALAEAINTNEQSVRH